MQDVERFDSAACTNLLNPNTMENTIGTCSVTLRLAKAQAVNTINQIERLTKACYIPSEDYTEPVWQEHKGVLYFDYKVYDLDSATMFHLGSMLGYAFGSASINTMLAKGTQKYRGYLRIEIQVPIKK